MNHHRHPTAVCRAHDGAHSFDLLSVSKVELRRIEVQFQPFEAAAGSTPLQLLQGVVAQRIEAAERHDAVADLRDLLCSPIVLRTHLLVLLGHRLRTYGVIVVSVREDDALSEAGGVELRDELFCRRRFLEDRRLIDVRLSRDLPSGTGPGQDEHEKTKVAIAAVGLDEVTGNAAGGRVATVRSRFQLVRRVGDCPARISGNGVASACPAGRSPSKEEGVVGIQLRQSFLVTPPPFSLPDELRHVRGKFDRRQQRRRPQRGGGRTQKVQVVVGARRESRVRRSFADGTRWRG